VYDKYGTTNPVERFLVEKFLNTVKDFVSSSPRGPILEVGSGEGRIADMVKGVSEREAVYACDLSEGLVKQASDTYGSVRFLAASAYKLPFRDNSFGLVVACEVFEHLEDPDAALQEAYRVAGGRLIASVPREPLWRVLNVARGKYLSDLGNTPGHLRHWNRRGFVDFLSSRFDVVKVRSPLPWTVCLCEKKAV